MHNAYIHSASGHCCIKTKKISGHFAILYIGRVPLGREILFAVYSTLPIVVFKFAFWDKYSDFLQSQSLENYKTDSANVEYFDFIIVGAGSAGCVLANRLSANASYTVLLLEDGGNPNPVQLVPAFALKMLHLPPIDYEYYTIPQRNSCLALNGQRSYWPRGRGLGGSSNLNGMFFQRGNPADYDRWADLSGSDEWKYDNVLENFKNIEDYHGEYYNVRWHRQGGGGVYVSTVVQAPPTALTLSFLEAGREMGYPTQDVNGRQEASFSRMDASIKNGKRFEAYQAFIQPILSRTNLKIYRYAKVLKVHLDENKEARGVTYVRHGVERYVGAKKEVIVSAGAVDSPKLLMLSGIGPREHLESLGIRTEVDLPVGQNLQDHVLVQIGPFNLATVGETFIYGRDMNKNELIRYVLRNSGVLAVPQGGHAVAYVHSAHSRSRHRNLAVVSPDIQLVFIPFLPDLLDEIEEHFSFKTGVFKEYMRGYENKDGFVVNVMLAKSNSRGEIKLSSKNPLDDPIIDPKYFSHPDDIRIMIEGLNFTDNLIENTNAFKKHGAHLFNNYFPGCENYALKTEQYFECLIRHMTLTVYHPCGTCSMGKGPSDPKAVVDPQLRVLKTKGLRVIDASIIPEIPNANLNAGVMMLADKGAEMISNFWAYNRE